MSASRLSVSILLALALTTCGKHRGDLSAFLTISPASPAPGQGIICTYRVKNTGTTIVSGGSYRVNLKLDGKTISFDNAGNRHDLHPGKEVTYTRGTGSFHAHAPASGVMKFELTVTPKWTFDDTDPANNTLVLSAPVKAP